MCQEHISNDSMLLPSKHCKQIRIELLEDKKQKEVFLCPFLSYMFIVLIKKRLGLCCQFFNNNYEVEAIDCQCFTLYVIDIHQKICLSTQNFFIILIKQVTFHLLQSKKITTCKEL